MAALRFTRDPRVVGTSAGEDHLTLPLVTVLTVVRNGARFLRRTIASVQAQTIPVWEYVIVDDASEDSTVDVVEHAARHDSRVRLLKRSEQGGPYLAANEGLAVARGRYVARIDSDDIARRNRLEIQRGFLFEHPHLKACAGF